MLPRNLRRHVAVIGMLVLAATVLPAGAADPAPAPKGDSWEVTTRMAIPGMPAGMPGMGAQKSQRCLPKEWKEPPAAADKDRGCVNSDFKVVGPKATWKVVCSGPPAMTGDGVITRSSDDAWSGAIQLTSEEMNLTINLEGKRLGDCDLKK